MAATSPPSGVVPPVVTFMVADLPLDDFFLLVGMMDYWELDRLEFKITEAPDINYAVGNKPELRPIVFVTHKEEKALPAAFLRRCIFHYIHFPESETQLQKILATQKLENQELSQKAIEIIIKLRDLDLSKRPGLSELLDWAGYLEAVETPIEELDKLPHLGTLLKQESDRQRAVEALVKA